MAGKACHAFGSTTRFGLTQALGVMSKVSGHLVVETSPAGDEIFVHGAPDDLRLLAKHLERLAFAAERGEYAHEHFFSAEWGGDDLAGLSTTSKNRAVHHIKLHGWPSVAEIPRHDT